MKRSVVNASASVPVRTVESSRTTLDSLRPAAIRADLRQSDPVGSQSTPVGSADISRQTAFGTLVWDALLRHYGSVKAMAISLGDIDATQLKRELETGKFRIERLEHLDAEARAALAASFADAYAPLRSPLEEAKRVLRDIRHKLDQVEQAIDYLEK